MPLGFASHEKLVPTSQVLEALMERVPTDEVTLAWLLEHLRTRSFGIVLLLLGILGLVPVISPAAGLLITIPAYQMMRARSAPVFPRALAHRALPAHRLAGMVQRIIPTLRYLERFVRPRWQTPFEATKRVIGGVVLVLGMGFLAPLPLSNIPVGIAVILVAFAYLEEDGILLAGAVVVALGILTFGAVTLWGTFAATVAVTR